MALFGKKRKDLEEDQEDVDMDEELEEREDVPVKRKLARTSNPQPVQTEPSPLNKEEIGLLIIRSNNRTNELINYLLTMQ